VIDPFINSIMSSKKGDITTTTTTTTSTKTRSPTRLYVGGLRRDVDKDYLIEVFAAFGAILSVSIHNQQTPSHAFIEYEDEMSANLALFHLQRHIFCSPSGTTTETTTRMNLELALKSINCPTGTILSKTKLFVGGLPDEVTEQQVNELFSPCGTIVSITLANNSAFVEFSKMIEAENAVMKLSKFEVSQNKPLYVRFAFVDNLGPTTEYRRKQSRSPKDLTDKNKGKEQVRARSRSRSPPKETPFEETRKQTKAKNNADHSTLKSTEKIFLLQDQEVENHFDMMDRTPRGRRNKIFEEFKQASMSRVQSLKDCEVKVHQITLLFQENFKRALKKKEEYFLASIQTLPGEQRRKLTQLTTTTNRILDTTSKKYASTLENLTFELEKGEMRQLSTVSQLLSNQTLLENQIQRLREEITSLSQQQQLVSSHLISEMRKLFQDL